MSNFTMVYIFTCVPRPPGSALFLRKNERESLVQIITCRDVHRVDLLAHAMNWLAWQTRDGDY